jgi:putative nucleotidyltransferase-like protein
MVGLLRGRRFGQLLATICQLPRKPQSHTYAFNAAPFALSALSYGRLPAAGLAMVSTVKARSDLLRQALITPENLVNLRISEWDWLLPEARSAGLLARLEALIQELDLISGIPEQVQPHLLAARRIAENENRVMRWELNRISRALASLDYPVILLKGGAYLVCDVPNVRGRISSDVDILVQKTTIDQVERALLNHGWRHMKLDNYDQYFYRHWSHELPPLQHRDRGTIVDVHHTILPPTGRLHPDAEKLIASSIPVEGTRFRVLARADLVLHSAAHAFQDGDLKRGLRDLVDIDDLLRHSSKKDQHFWEVLTRRADELNLTRPLYYALRYSDKYLRTPIPREILDGCERWRPAWPASALMDAIVDQVITVGQWTKDLKVKFSEQLLYIRSHWLRMPPYRLIPHLIRKALMRRSERT